MAKLRLNCILSVLIRILYVDNRIVLIAVALILETSAVASDMVDLRDPTIPLAGSAYSQNTSPQAENSAEGFRLQAVLMSGGVRYAVLDGQSFRVGQEYRGYIIRSVTRDSVVLATPDGSVRKTLWLFSNRVKNND